MEYTLEFGMLLGFIFSLATVFYVAVCIKTYSNIKEQELHAKIKLITRQPRVKRSDTGVISISEIREEANEQVQDARQKVRQVGVIDN